MVGHIKVNLACQLDEASMEIVFFGLPGEIKGIDRNAVTSQARPWIKRMESEGLGRGGADDFPDVDPHAQTQELEFIYEGYVHAPVNVLKQLGHFRRGGR